MSKYSDERDRLMHGKIVSKRPNVPVRDDRPTVTYRPPGRPSRQEFFAAQKILQAGGWEHVLSTLDEVKDGDRFGLLYVKGESKFWLNHLTIASLPE